MVKRRGSSKENLDLAKEHVKIAEDLVADEGRKNNNPKVQDKATRTYLELEKAEADLDELEEEDFDEEIED